MTTATCRVATVPSLALWKSLVAKELSLLKWGKRYSAPPQWGKFVIFLYRSFLFLYKVIVAVIILTCSREVTSSKLENFVASSAYPNKW
jgi:hypothetical protein